MSNEKKVILSVRDLVLQIAATGTLIDYGSFDIALGDFVILKGNNGSGKSTFFKIFSTSAADNYCRHARGSVRYLEGDLAQKAVLADRSGTMPQQGVNERQRLLRRIVYISQEESFTSYASAEKAILQATEIAIDEEPSLTAAQRKKMKADARSLCKYYYEKVLLAYKSFDVKSSTFKIKKATSYSGGQQKMLSLISGLVKAEVMKSKLLLMDEPLNNLDSKNKTLFRELLEGMRQKRAAEGDPIAIMAITHCQIFEGINKVITITVDPAVKCNTAVCVEGSLDCHRECLEDGCLGVCYLAD